MKGHTKKISKIPNKPTNSLLTQNNVWLQKWFCGNINVYVLCITFLLRIRGNECYAKGDVGVNKENEREFYLVTNIRMEYSVFISNTIIW